MSICASTLEKVIYNINVKLVINSQKFRKFLIFKGKMSLCNGRAFSLQRAHKNMINLFNTMNKFLYYTFLHIIITYNF